MTDFNLPAAVYQPAEPVLLDQFYPYVLPYCIGAPLLAVRINLISAAIEFCERSRVWKYAPAAIDTVAGQGVYAVPGPPGADCVVVEEVYFNGDRLKPVTPDDLPGLFADWSAEVGTPEVFTSLDPDALTLVPAPDATATGAIVLRGSFQPQRSADTLPAFLFRTYAEAIAAGALARLLLVPGQSWSNPELGQFNKEQFDTDIAAAGDAARGFVRGPIRVRSSY